MGMFRKYFRMKTKALAAGLAVVSISLGAVLVSTRNDLARLRDSNEALTHQMAEAAAEAERALDSARPSEAELERQKQERDELLKLRGEVSSLRKEKEAWEKRLAADNAAALAAAEQRKLESQRKPTPGQWLESVLNGPAMVKGAEAGHIRRKFLNREPLTEAEQALLNGMMARTAEIEKSPEEFSNFQSAFIGSLLGWNNDPRMQQLQKILTAASTAAINRGFDYSNPAANAQAWAADQQALNARATGGVQRLLSADEKALFDKAFIGVLGVDIAGGAPR